MKIFSASQLKAWDAHTINEEGITSAALMERAAEACYQWLIAHQFTQFNLHVFCGKGNNGGDGLAIARLLLASNIPVNTYILESGKQGSEDFQINLQRLHQLTTDIHFIQSANFLPNIEKGDVIIDALYGSGLNRPLEGISYQLVDHLNRSGNIIISVDVPGGLFCDRSSKGQMAITATHTLCFQNTRLAFLMPENDKFIGEFHLIDIGLSKHFENTTPAFYEILNATLIKNINRPRNKFSHKGTFGHVALVAGSYGMMGAAVLAARACLQTGPGKLTCYIPASGYDIMQISVPEAMCKISGEKAISPIENTMDFDAIGIGPGLGQDDLTVKMFQNLLEATENPCVLDADALNILANNSDLWKHVPGGSVITPHPTEFERLFGTTENNFAQLQLAIDKASAFNIYIVLKGHYTAIITPRGKVYFNNTGNAGMAKAGMGDVLTGMITGLLSQHYLLPEAALLAVYLHGLAGDIAATKYSGPAMQASNLIDCIPDAWMEIKHSVA